MSTFSTKDNIMNEYMQKKGLYEHLSVSVLQITEGLMRKHGIKYATAEYRIKEENSLSEKIRKKGDKYKALSDITDIGGIRIITYYANDVDRVAELIEREFKVDKENSIDKRKTLGPKVFGYLSLHYVICLDDRRAALPEYENLGELKVEIQIRSILQHAWAEMEHDMGYKSNVEVPSEIVRDFSRLAGLLEIADKEFQEIRDFLETYREKVEAEISEKSDYGTPDCELDAVVLEAVLKTKPNFQELNRRIGEIAGMKIRVPAKQKDKQDYYGGTLQKLNCLGISTTAQLDQLAERGADLASYLADKFLRDRYKTEPEGATLPNTIGVFYLCYAQLILNNYSKERVVQYMENTSIGVLDERDPFVQNLLKYGREFAVQQ